MTTQISSDNIQPSTLESIGGGPTITNVQVTNSSYVVLDDTAVDTTGGYIKITGSRYASGVQVYVGNTLATSVSIVSSTVLNVQVPAISAGSYDLYVVNTDGSFGIKPNGITFSPNSVTWVTGSTLTTQANGIPISIQLSATNATGYQLQNGSTLPTGLNLTSGGLLSGTVIVENDTTYSFTVEAYDAELQDAPRTFSLIISTATAPTSIDYLVVAGGGGGGDRHGGGGGAGGYRAFTATSVSTGTAYTITVGSGGTAGSYESGPTAYGGRGVDSSLIGGAISTTALGGGGGGTYDGNPTGSFGSGGGGGGNDRPGIAGTAGQGNSGGSGSNPGGGGGGGAGAVGGNASTAGSGGIGLQWLDGNYYAGGGGGGWQAAGGPATPGGNGGGGAGAWDDATIQAGTTNTGGGGGGSRSNNSTSTGRPGGSGVVIIRYPDSYTAAASTTGSPTITVTGGYRYYKFTGSGSITF